MLAVLALGGCGKKNASESGGTNQPKEIRIGVIRVPNDTQVAMQQKFFDSYFADKGIKTTFIFFDSGVAANQAFASGSIDFAEMGYTNGVVALANDLPVELIWLHEILGENEALVAKNGKKIKQVADLKGKKIATPFSSTSHFSLLKALEDAGIEKDVTLLDMETAEIVAAWERGDLDAAYTWEPTLSTLKKTGEVLVDSRQLAEKGYMTTNIELVHTDFSKKYPELVRDFILGLNEAVEFYHKSPDKAAQAAAKSLDITKADALKQMQATQWLTAKEELGADYLGTNATPGNYYQVFEDTATFLKEQGSIKAVPSKEKINAFINSEYIEAGVEK